MLSFVGKHLRFLPKGCPFIFCIFYLDEQQVCLIKYAENEISNSSFHKQKEKKKEKEEQKHNPTSKSSFVKLLKNCH